MCVICGVQNDTSELICINCGWDFTHDVFTYSSVSKLTKNELDTLALNVKNAQNNLLPDDIHTKTTVEIITLMYKRFGKDVFLNSDQLKTLMEIWLHDRSGELKKFLYAVEKNIPQIIFNRVNENIEIETTLQEIKKELADSFFLEHNFINLIVDGFAVAFKLIDEKKGIKKELIKESAETSFSEGSRSGQIVEFLAATNEKKNKNVTVFDIINGTIIKYNGNLKNVVIPSVINNERVMAIGNSAFKDCSSLIEITIPKSVISIWRCAFENCSSLTRITIPNSVTSIGSCAFRYCSNLTQITIPESVTSIGSFAFGNCRSLSKIIIPNSVSSIGEHAFMGCSILTIIANKNSHALKYAKKNNIRMQYL